MLRRTSSLLCAWLTVSLCASGAAQDTGTSDDEALRRERALALYGTARSLDAEGRTDEALPLAEEAYRLYPSGGTRYAMGLLHERLGHSEEASLHYRMALAEARPPTAEVRAGIAAALERLGAPVSPLDPVPLDPEPRYESESTPVTPSALGPAEGGARTDPAAPPGGADLDADEASPIVDGFRLDVGLVVDLTHAETAWAGYIAAGWHFDIGAFVYLEVDLPSFAAVLNGGFEIGDWVLRPIVGALFGVAPLRTFDTSSEVAVFVGPRLGVALHPFDDAPLAFALTGALAVDLARVDEGFAFTVPLALSARWVF
ncbi:MAG: tetratricopeptide repeat protein [Sandaracinaceae bacterium]